MRSVTQILLLAGMALSTGDETSTSTRAMAYDLRTHARGTHPRADARTPRTQESMRTRQYATTPRHALPRSEAPPMPGTPPSRTRRTQRMKRLPLPPCRAHSPVPCARCIVRMTHIACMGRMARMRCHARTHAMPGMPHASRHVMSRHVHTRSHMHACAVTQSPATHTHGRFLHMLTRALAAHTANALQLCAHEPAHAHTHACTLRHTVLCRATLACTHARAHVRTHARTHAHIR